MSYRSVSTSYQSQFIEFLTAEHVIDRLSWNVDKQLPLLAAYRTRRAQFSSKETLELHENGKIARVAERLSVSQESPCPMKLLLVECFVKVS